MNAQQTEANGHTPAWLPLAEHLLAGTTEYVEVRALKPEGGIAGRLHTRDVAAIGSFCAQHNGVNDVLIGVTTRIQGGGKKSDCREATELWADIDFKDFAGGE